MNGAKTQTQQFGSWLKVLVLLFLALSLIIMGIAGLGGKEEIFSVVLRLTELLNSHETTGQAIFLGALFLASLTGVIPLSLLAVVSGALYGLLNGFILSAIGVNFGALIAFLLSRYAYRSNIDDWESRHLSIRHLDREIALRGWIFVLLLRLSPIAPYSIASYAFGLTRISTGAYMLGSIGATPALLAYVYTGSLSGMALMTLSGNNTPLNSFQLSSLILGFIATITCAFYFAHIARKGLKEYEEPIE
ncbi:MAG: VTT domain-containing protein [Methylococcaceae bacterium]